MAEAAYRQGESTGDSWPAGFLMTVAPGPGNAFTDTSLGETPAANDDGTTITAPDPMHVPEHVPAVQAIVAKRRDGTLYASDLMADILQYRELRTRSLRGGAMSETESGEFEQLEARLRQTGTDTPAEVQQLRMFYRFDCDFLADLHMTTPEGQRATISARIEDISAGGVKVAFCGAIETGEAAALMVPMLRDGKVVAVTLPSRIAWKSATHIGLMFAGAPHWGGAWDHANE